MSEMQNAKYARTSVYAGRPTEPKHLFKCVGERLKDAKLDRVLDVGCAAGELLGYLTSVLPVKTAVGVDIDPMLTSLGKERYPHVDFETGSFLDNNVLASQTFDAITMVGVFSVFDDPKLVLDKTIHLTADGGKAVIVSIFNEFDVDVLIRWKYSDKDNYNPGYNHFSKSTISQILSDNARVKGFSFEKFELPFDLAKNPDDPIRSWTEKDVNGKRILFNGLGMEINLQFLEINLK
jgi:SAM-dependent methyltransferase